ncbi:MULTISPECIES: PAS domain-containing protein [Pontibacter]|uniref:histidine kinase n=1 Tax=Pontibacter lucknowensis TaxID=1077936 RepID=A0A1N6YKN4_9BACT|nr:MULTISPECIES: PAS domain-containing protein [Pontibacter]SIR15170.1 PAS domain S-box-containing protein [Pontibacter lucknowensis]
MDFNRLFNSIPEPIVVLSPEYKVVAATDAFLESSLRTRDQLIGLHFLLEAFPERENSYQDNAIKKGLDQVLQTKKAVRLGAMRYDIQKPESQGGGYEVRFWEVNQTPILDSEGNVEYIMQKPFDVTEREVSQVALQKSEEKFKVMAEALPQLIYTIEPGGKTSYFNKRWEEYTGINLETLLQIKWDQMIHPDDLENTLAKWETAAKEGAEMQMELRMRDKNGTYRWHLSRSIPMKDADGNITMWIGSSTDIHDTRKLVQELLDSNEQMALLSDQVQHAYEKAESERKTLERLIMEAPAMFVILRGPEHRFELMNDKYQQLYPGRNLIGMPLGEALPDIKAQGFTKLLDRVYETGETYIAEGVPIILPKDGTDEMEERFFNFSYQPMYEAGKITGILAFGYDITNEILFKRKLEDLSSL